MAKKTTGLKLEKGSVTIWATAVALLIGLITLYTRFRNSRSTVQRWTNFQMNAGRTDNIILRVFESQTKYNPVYAMYWASVSRLETGNYTSGLFLSARNLWGMHMPKIRKTTASGTVFSQSENAYMAKYNTVEDSAKDILLYMDALSYPRSVESLKDHIRTMKDKGYFSIDFNDYFNRVEPIFLNLTQ